MNRLSGDGGHSALHVACHQGFHQLCHSLIRYKADVALTNTAGYTPRAAPFHPDGDQFDFDFDFDFVLLPARTMHTHVGPQHVRWA